MNCASTRRQFLAAAAIAGPTSLLPTAARSQNQWPSRPVQMIVGFPAGGTTDIVARLLAERLSSVLGQPVVVDNRSGAGGSIGATLVAQSNPDGYTLQMSTVGTGAINYSLYPSLPFKASDIASVSRICEVTNVIMVNRDLPAKNLQELVALAKQKPGEITYGHSGVGTSLHLCGELLGVEAGIRLTHVPFRGASQMLPELIAGRIDMGIDNVPSSLQQIRDGQVRAIAVTSATRAPGLPDVPTAAEQGFPTVQAMAWWGVQVPKRTPRPIVDKLAQAMDSIAKDPAFQAKMAEQGAQTVSDTPEQFEAFVAAEIEKWRNVIAKANIRVE